LNAALLELEDLTAGYSKLAIVQNVNLTVDRGSILALIGPNGSGKSTLIKSIVGAANVLNGRIRFHGRDIASLPAHQIIKLGIGYVPQTENIFSNLTVQDNLELGGYVIDDKQIIRERIEEIFQLFPILNDKRKQKAKTLSGGVRQILAIGKALMTKPTFMMLDEPTASVDPGMVSQIVKKICEVREGGVTLVLVEQNVKKALEIADHTIVMVAGRKVFDGDAKEVSDHKELAEIFLGKKVY
jgi:ABC-type branched-subunit amino acid transport system ATPase component